MQQEQLHLLTPAEAAQCLRVTRRTLDAWRVRGIGPRSVRIVGKIAYRREDLLAFISGNLQDTPSPDQ